MHPYVHSGITNSGQDMDKTKYPSVDDWIKKMWCISDGISTTQPENEILPFATT